MHPGMAHQSMAPPSSALRLGFTDIKSANKSVGHRGLDGTPTKIKGMSNPSFDFQLSANAQAMMDDIREQAAQIKAELRAQREADGGSGDYSDRKFAQPKGKTGRFSAAHMAEFKKMDSIEGHASAWRAQNFTPVVSGTLKRSSSKANLDGTPTSVKNGLKRSPMKANLDDTPNNRPKASLKRSSSVANLDSQQESQSPKKPQPAASFSKPTVSSVTAQSAPSKRIKKRQEDDISNARPISRDGSSIPRPTSSGNGAGNLTRSQSTFGRLTSPTKSFLAHSARQGKPTVSLVSPSPPKAHGLTKSASTQSFISPSKAAELKRRIISPGRFDKVKSILRGNKSNGEDAKTALPGPPLAMSQTPGPPRVDHRDKALPPIPLTTPRRKLTKHVAFTPEVSYSPANQGTPTPKRSILKSRFRRPLEDIQYPTMDGVLTETKTDDVKYPDLSGFKNLIENKGERSQDGPKARPGTFTFRSDHTIEFGGASPAGFGGCSGQSSIRQVRGSLLPTQGMPGSFPAPPEPSTHPNKENKGPSPAKGLIGAPHGMANKKRSRPSTDEEDAEREAAERAAKKRKNEDVPEGIALFAPDLAGQTPSGSVKKRQAIGTPTRKLGHTPVRTPSRTPIRTPSRTPGSASTSKKRPILSMSRLNMLSRPKART